MTDPSAETPRSNARGWLIGGFVILLLIGSGIFKFYLDVPRMGGDKHKIIEDLHRYHRKHGKWPSDLEQLQSSIPDYAFKGHYDYFHNGAVFVLRYSGSGMIGKDFGEFYRSDTKEWKELYANRKELFDLEEKLKKRHKDSPLSD